MNNWQLLKLSIWNPILHDRPKFLPYMIFVEKCTHCFSFTCTLNVWNTKVVEHLTALLPTTQLVTIQTKLQAHTKVTGLTK